MPLTSYSAEIFSDVFKIAFTVERLNSRIRFNYRRNEERKSDAEADALVEENNRKSVEWLEKRIEQRDAKIDGLYAELRKEQSEKLELLHKLHQLEIEHTLKRCEVKNCGGRKPPSGY